MPLHFHIPIIPSPANVVFVVVYLFYLLSVTTYAYHSYATLSQLLHAQITLPAKKIELEFEIEAVVNDLHFSSFLYGLCS